MSVGVILPVVKPAEIAPRMTHDRDHLLVLKPALAL